MFKKYIIFEVYYLVNGISIIREKELNSEEEMWPRQNFSLHYRYNIKQTSDEKKEKCQLGGLLVDSIPNSPN